MVSLGAYKYKNICNAYELYHDHFLLSLSLFLEAKIPMSVLIFIWKLMDHISSYYEVVEGCVFCESIDHIFLKCDFAIAAWV